MDPFNWTGIRKLKPDLISVLTNAFIIEFFVHIMHVESRMIVEKIRYKGHVQFFISIDNISRCDKSTTTKTISLSQHFAGPVNVCRSLKQYCKIKIWTLTLIPAQSLHKITKRIFCKKVVTRKWAKREPEKTDGFHTRSIRQKHLFAIIIH